MDAWTTGIAEYGYSVLFLVVFLEAIGVPVPAAVALLVAGAASARGSMNPAMAAACAISAMMLGDQLMFLLGRYTGWWLLGVLCRLSLNPESCILRSADSFYRRGRTLLVIAKFIPGINTMAPPLAGSMNMRLWQFLRLDFAGAVLYGGAYLAVGWICSGVLGAVTKGYAAVGQVLSWVLMAAAVGYLGVQVWMWRKSRAWRSVPMVGPADVASALAAGTAVIYDVRSHGYYDPKAMRIRGSRRLDPNALNRFQSEGAEGAQKAQVYLYCTCVREATSARVAYALRARGMDCAVIRGGLRAWRKAGLPLEAVPAEEMSALPVFDS
jgi:membrane protein DedA with SNARE-associated domain/rhodanese-related sulfurtransferase